MRKILVFLSFFIYLFLGSSIAYAEENFTSDYRVTYTINNDASAHVQMNVTLTNLSSRYYASSYKIQLGFKDPLNVKASDAGGPIAPSVIKNSKGSSVDLNFNTKVVGQGSKFNFSMSFDTSEVAQNQGNLWEINIPGLSSQNDFSSFNASVIVPSSLGKPSYIKPMVGDNPNRQVGNTLNFTKSELSTAGISIAFGDYQIYDYNLKYHLNNKNLFPVTTEIALPPSTNYQDVIIDRLNPKPMEVRIDKDGNWLAKYYLYPSKNLDITANGKVKIFLKPKKEALSNDLKNRYLEQKPYWETQNPKISSLAKQLKTPAAIYQYVVDNLSYDFSRVTEQKPRLGAVKVLSDSTSAVCLEFTDLFIALARAAGIPAREINGFAYTKNPQERPLSLVEDVLHSWPEYYDFGRQAWIMVDPTWGNTTGGVDYFTVMDFDHFAFVRKGLNSTYPVPAGGYKLTANSKTKDVNVVIGSEFQMNKSLQVSLDLPPEVVAGTPIEGQIRVKNIGNTISDAQSVTALAKLLPASQILWMDTVPPYGEINVPIKYKNTDFLTRSKDTVKIQIGKNSISKEISIIPLYLSKWFLLGGIFIAGISIIISIIIRGFRRIPVSKPQK
ncbi:transglutaminase family protein [Patescibacteria group bacterium]|nr:transglutaminase family protein [Patescibacteria group bacterium]